MAVIKANYVKRGTGERETAKANIRYIQERPGRDKEKLTRPLFGSSGFLGRHEAYQFIDEEAKRGRYFYRFKFSPDPSMEDTKRDLNMYKLTRRMMKRLEKRLKKGTGQNRVILHVNGPDELQSLGHIEVYLDALLEECIANCGGIYPALGSSTVYLGLYYGFNPQG